MTVRISAIRLADLLNRIGVAFLVLAGNLRGWASKRVGCPHRGCTVTDGKPCAFAGCPNRTSQA